MPSRAMASGKGPFVSLEGRRATSSLAALLAVGAALAARPAAAQFEARAVVTNAAGTRIRERHTYVSGSRVRVDDGDRGVIVSRDGAGSVITLDHARRTFSESPLAPAAPANRLEQSFDVTTMALLALPPGRAPLRMVRSKGKRTVLGMQAVEIQLYRGERQIAESWHAPGRDATAIADAMEAVLFPRLLARSFDRDEAVFRERLRAGFPLVEKDLEAGRTITVVELRNRTPPATVFAPPAGYRRRPGVAP